MKSDAATVEAYLAALPDDRREAVETVRRVVLEHLPDGYEETMDFGMIAYVVPLETHPDTYNGHPLMYAALASQKHHMALYLQSIYADTGTGSRFEKDYRATGKRFDVGKSCVFASGRSTTSPSTWSATRWRPSRRRSSSRSRSGLGGGEALGAQTWGATSSASCCMSSTCSS